MKKATVLTSMLMVSVVFLFTAFTSVDVHPTDEWDIPEKYQTMENPYPGEDIQTGKSLYMRHCRMCHGNKGEAGTPKARKLNYEGTLYGETFEAQSDGVVYYKSIIGWPDEGMPNYEKRIRNERDRWAVVNYVRTLADEN